MIRQCLLSLISFLVLPASAVADEITDSVEIGGRAVKIPAPVGFVRCDGVNAEWDKVMATMQAPTNRVIANYGTQVDHDALRAGEFPDYSENFNVQVMRTMEAKEFGTETFAGIKAETATEVKNASAKIQEQASKVISEGGKKLADEFGVDAALSVSDTAMLGIFHEDAQSFGFTMALKMKIETPKGPEVTKSVVACIMQPVNGRLLMFYSTKPYLSEDDRTKAETSVKEWAAATFAANPQVKGPAAKRGIFDGTGRAGLIGAIGGVAVAAILALKKKIMG